MVLVRESVLAPTLAGIPSRKLAGSESCEDLVRDRNVARAALVMVHAVEPPSDDLDSGHDGKIFFCIQSPLPSKITSKEVKSTEWHCRAAMGFCGHRITVRAGFAG